MRRLSLAHLTAIDLDPPALIRAAATAGFDAVGLRLLRLSPTTPGYPLMEDAAMMEQTQAALHDTGLAVHDIEFVRITPEISVPALMRFLEAGRSLGAREVIAAPYDPDHARLADSLGRLAEAAQAQGLGVSLEFFPWTSIRTLDDALHIVTRAGPSVGILPDALHVDRSGSSLATLAALPPERLRFAHLCDAPVLPAYDEAALLFTARQERLLPGQGQIDLHGFLAALPPDLPLGIEVPRTAMMKRAQPEEMIRSTYRVVRDFLGGPQASPRP